MGQTLRPIALILFLFHLWLAWEAKPGFFIPAMTTGSIAVAAIGVGAWFNGPSVGQRWLNALPLTTVIISTAYLIGYFMYLMVP
jgi:hypothetical protein